MPQIDNLMLFRCVQVARRLMGKNRDVGLFCNIAASTLVDAEIFPQFTEFLDANRVIAPLLFFEFTQAACRAFGPIENESLAALSGCGFRFAMDQVTDLKLEPRELADRGFRFVKAPAALLLNRHGARLGDIHAADLTGLLLRFGIELIADKIENEATVVDLLDYDVRYGQGYLFSQPRPLRAEILQAAPTPRAATAASATPTGLAVPGAGAAPAAIARTEVVPVGPEAPFRVSANVLAGPVVARPADSRDVLQRPTVLAQIARTLAAGGGTATGVGEDPGSRSP
jgi:cyclic-di-GMP phosphodiesterase TipF (flagellum assembly factor)